MNQSTEEVTDLDEAITAHVQAGFLVYARGTYVGGENDGREYARVCKKEFSKTLIGSKRRM